MKMHWFITLFVGAALTCSTNLFAQVPTCGANVPFFQVNLVGNPTGSWTSPSHSRTGNCCGTYSPDRCTSFEIILDPATAQINFEIASGAVPTGAMFYQINLRNKDQAIRLETI